MDIISTIKRPADQQCYMVDVKPWENFFGPSTGWKDYDESWGDITNDME